MADPAAKAFHGGASFDAIGVDFADLARRHQIIDADVLDAWYEPAPAVLAVLRENLAWLVKTSPPTHGAGLRAAIAARQGLAAANVLVGGGTSALIFLAFAQLLKAGDCAVILDPMYGEYRHVCEQVIGARVVASPLDAARAFRPDPIAIADRVIQAQAKLLVLVNPNSPTGMVLGRDGLAELLRRLPAEVRVWIDETYIDFVPDVPSAEPLVAQDQRLIVAKSMSKFFALSGLRVGYLAAHARVINEFELRNPPWSVGLLAQCAAVTALQEYAWYRQRAQETHALREALAEAIAGIDGLRPFASTTNFVMFETVQLAANLLVERCRDHGVFLRDCASLSERFGARYVRTAVKDGPANARIVAALRAATAAG